tara:strand:- start:615 stop:818 length:204 start_codon:yes stop_codon:yes gene_type:complete
MINRNLKDIADKLNQLACKECTKGWINDRDNLTDPIEDIENCFSKGFISSQLKNRLIAEIKDIQKEV